MTASITTLPLETLLQITSYLPPEDCLALGWACRDLYHQLPPRTGPWDMHQLLKIERWPRYSPPSCLLNLPAMSLKNRFACHHCKKLRPAINFFNTMIRGNRGKHSKKVARWNRICLDCCAEAGWTRCGKLPRRVLFSYGGPAAGTAFICDKCQRLTRGFRLCNYDMDRVNWKCDRCFTSYQWDKKRIILPDNTEDLDIESFR